MDGPALRLAVCAPGEGEADEGSPRVGQAAATKAEPVTVLMKTLEHMLDGSESPLAGRHYQVIVARHPAEELNPAVQFPGSQHLSEHGMNWDKARALRLRALLTLQGGAVAHGHRDAAQRLGLG